MKFSNITRRLGRIDQNALMSCLVLLVWGLINCSKEEQKSNGVDSPTKVIVTGPRGSLIAEVDLKEPSPEGQLAIAIWRQLERPCVKANTSIANGANMGAIRLSEYEDLVQERERMNELIKKLGDNKLASVSWIRETHVAYSMFLDEFDTAFFQNPDIKVLEKKTFMGGTDAERTTEIIGPYEQVRTVCVKLDEMNDKIVAFIPILAILREGEKIGDRQRAQMRELLEGIPALSKEFKTKYKKVSGADEHLKVMASFFYIALRLSAK